MNLEYMCQIAGVICLLLAGVGLVGVIYAQWLQGHPKRKNRPLVGVLFSIAALVIFSTICVSGGV